MRSPAGGGLTPSLHSSSPAWLQGKDARLGAGTVASAAESGGSEVELRPGRPPVVGPGDERQVVGLLDAATVAGRDEPVGERELDLDLAGVAGVVRLDRARIFQGALRARLDQRARFLRRLRSRAEAAEPDLDLDG